ncbi:MAG: ABC transporter permease [Erysipelotrichaceae bacterium]|nr:ABC transporter permease [Erysipelotrichaceae bacterium]
MIRALCRHFREAFQGIFRHFAMSLSSASAVTFALILVSGMMLIIGNISQITMDLQESVNIFVRIDQDVEEDRVAILQMAIEHIEGVNTVTYSDKDEELNKLIEEFGEDGKMFEIYRGENNPLSRAFVVEIKQNYKISDVSAQISKIPGVSEAVFGGTNTEMFIEMLTVIRTGGVVVVLVLAVLAMFLISNTIKITIAARQKEISIMRHVGATNSYIRMPFVLEGIFIGLMGSVIPILITIMGYDYFYYTMGGKLITGLLSLQPTIPFVFYVSGVLAAMGVFVGFVGSIISVNKKLRWKR